MNTNRKVEIVRSWGTYPVGTVLEPPGVLRSVLIDEGFAKPVEADRPLSVRRAVRKPVAERAVSPHVEPETAAKKSPAARKKKADKRVVKNGTEPEDSPNG